MSKSEMSFFRYDIRYDNGRAGFEEIEDCGVVYGHSYKEATKRIMKVYSDDEYGNNIAYLSILPIFDSDDGVLSKDMIDETFP